MVVAHAWLFLASVAVCMEYDGNKAAKQSDDIFIFSYNIQQLLKRRCENHVFDCNQAGGLNLPLEVKSAEDWVKIHDGKGCRLAKFPLTPEGFLDENLYYNYLVRPENLGLPARSWRAGEDPLPESPDDIEDRLGCRLRPGDVVYFQPIDGPSWHNVIVVETSSTSIKFNGQNDPNVNSEYHRDLFDFIRQRHDAGRLSLTVIHFPDRIKDCRAPAYDCKFDSTTRRTLGYSGSRDSAVSGSDGGRITHAQQCCWHEHLANTWPWYSDSSAYACLTWPESSGTVWDSMISPRMNFVGDSAIRFRQSTYSSLAHLQGATIAVKGSTDNGVTWPFTLGDDGLTEADMPWADNQRNVRILWVYKGDPQPDYFWCIDDVEIWAKPTRGRDVSVSGVARPYGLISQGRTVTPAAMVWNHGKQLETLDVTLSITPGYTNTQTAILYPYNDTLLEFEPWLAQVGSFTATAFTAQDSDECRANDTASLAFRVAGDSWLDLGEIYGNWGGGLGSCMATVGENEIWAVIGHQQYFAVYNCDQNLFVPKAQTPGAFSNNSGLAYPGSGDYLYAIKSGTHSLYRYSMSSDTWVELASAPGNVNGGFAYGGNGYLYGLRRTYQRTFYRYSIADNSWDTLAPMSAEPNDGSCLAWGGGDYLYALQGDGTTGFYRYSISGNSWQWWLAPAPGNVEDGGALTYCPRGNRLYAFMGNGSRWFGEYDIASDTWFRRWDLPAEPQRGACLAYSDHSVYAMCGSGNDHEFYRYALGGNLDVQPVQIMYPHHEYVTDSLAFAYPYGSVANNYCSDQSVPVRMSITPEELDLPRGGIKPRKNPEPVVVSSRPALVKEAAISATAPKKSEAESTPVETHKSGTGSSAKVIRSVTWTSPEPPDHARLPENLPAFVSLPPGLDAASYSHDTTVLIPANQTIGFGFPQCTLALGKYRVVFKAMLSGDENPSNDSMIDSVRVRRYYDAVPTRIIEPSLPDYSVLDSVYFSVMVANRSDTGWSFPVKFWRNDTLRETTSVALAARESCQVEFAGHLLPEGTQNLKFATCLGVDEKCWNDTIRDTILIRPARDAAARYPIAPAGLITSDTPFVVIPTGWVRNNYDETLSVPARMRIGDSCIRETLAVVPDRESALVTFAPCTLALGRYLVSMVADLDSDEIAANDSIAETLLVRKPIDAAVTRLLAPLDSVYTIEDAIPLGAMVANHWDSALMFPVRLLGNDTLLDQQDVEVPGLDSVEVWFDARSLRHGNRTLKFIACLDSDERCENDTLAKTIRVKAGDYWVMLDSAPVAQARLAVDSAGCIYAAARDFLRVDFYDPGSDLWNRLSNPPVSAVYGITAVDSTVYVLGLGTYQGLGQGGGLKRLEGSTQGSQAGKTQGGTTQKLTPGPVIWRYEPENDSWLFVAACGPLVLLSSSSNLVGTHDRTIYVVGCGPQTFRYFLARDSWATVPSAPVINNWGAAGWMDGRLYAIASSSALWRFSEGDGQWSSLPGPGKGLDYGSALACDRAAERAFAFWRQGTTGKGFSELRDTGRTAGQLTWLGRQSLASETLGAAMCFGATQGYCLDGAGGFWRYRPEPIYDLSVVGIILPESVHADTNFTPHVIVQNNWQDSLSFTLTMYADSGGGYQAPGFVIPGQTRQVLSMGSMALPPGLRTVFVDLSMTGSDSVPANDHATGTVWVPLRHDAAAVAIFGVTGGVRYDSLLHPGGVISNLWSDSLEIRVKLAVDSVYLESAVVNVPAQHSETIWFDTCRLSIGKHDARLVVGMEHDELAGNDTIWSTVDVIGNGWLAVHPASSSNPVLCDGVDSVLYAADRYGPWFNEYNMLQDSWRGLATPIVTGMISLSRAGDKVFGLASGEVAGCIKRYRTDLDQWSAVTNSVPVQLSDACGLVAQDSLTLYLVGPGGLNSFWRFDVAGDSWHHLSSLPAMSYKWVSCAFDPGDLIYVLTDLSGRVYQYDIGNDNWSLLTTLPQSMSTPAALSIDDQRNRLPALGVGTVTSAQSAEFSLPGCAWTNQVAFPGSASHPSLTVSNGRLFGTGGGSEAAATFAEYVRVTLDAAALDIVALPDTFRSDSVPHPGGVIRNLSWVPITCQATLACGTSQQQQQVQLAPMQYDTVWFGGTLTYPPGVQTVSLTVSCTGDENSGNDVSSRQVFVRAPWVPRAQSFEVGRLDSDSSSVFVAERQSNKVMQYDPAQDLWQSLRPSPLASGCLDLGYWDSNLFVLGGLSLDRAGKETSRQKPGKSGCDQLPYAIYRLALGDTLWQAVCESLPDSTSPGWLIPTDNGLYLLPATGSKLLRLDSTGWTERAQLPAAVAGVSATDWDRQDTFFFAFVSDSGAQQFLSYSVTGDTWRTLTAPPESAMALAVEPGNSRVLMMALDSLGSVMYEYDRAQDAWTLSPDAPPQTYAGMALCFGQDDAWLMTGGPTQGSSFWRYDPDYPGGADHKGGLGGAAGWAGQLQLPCLNCEPNPFTGSCRITYALPKPGRACLKLYDVSGRLVTTLVNGYTPNGRHVTNVYSRDLANGVYVLKLESADYRATRKLILE